MTNSWRLPISFTTVLTVGVLFWFPVFAIAQKGSGSMPDQMLHAAPESMIDGAQHPELIPDSSAYRLVFTVLGLAVDATADEQTARALRLQNIGLADTDVNTAMVVLDSFKNQYGDVIQSFNNSAHALITRGGTPDVQSFDKTRDALVQSTRDRLKQMLSPEGIAALDKFIQQEKTRMKIPTNLQ